MGDLDKKSKEKDGKKAKDAERKRRADIDDQDGAGDGTHLLPWDADVEDFMEQLERLLNHFRTAMTSVEFKLLVSAFRELSMSERRAVSNRLKKRGLDSLLMALSRGDFRTYIDGWEAEAVRNRTDEPHGDAP